MRILYIHQYFTTRDGAGGTRSYEFAKQWVQRGHQVTIITTDNKLQSYHPVTQGFFFDKYLIDGITVYAVHVPYSNYMSYFKRMLSFFKFTFYSSLRGLFLRKYDVVFATSTPLTVGIPALILHYFKRKPFVFEVRDLWPEAPIQMGAINSKPVIKLLKALERQIYTKATHVIALSPGMRKGVLDEGVAHEKVTVVPNCSDLDLFKDYDEDAVQQISKQYNLRDHFSLIHNGSMGIANGLDYIIEAAKISKGNNDNIVYILTGDGKEKPRLEELCEKYQLDNVIFTGKVIKKDIPNYVNAADMAITTFKNIPILATNSPNKFFDAIAAGKPVIVNSNGWTKDIVETYENGFYVNPEEPNELVEKLHNIKNDQVSLQKMGDNSRKLAEKEYDRVKLARDVENILNDVSSRSFTN
ncbi:glycosyltransferase family 4 protein [Salibacterium aidingense]|uniref:glycosyltransferase family 4 protein n=1 Tax=Salibacterium aidingense TaxID=384933 RepID=UPI003BDB513B